MPTISLIHATRSRKDLMFSSRDKWWLDRATQPGRIEHIYGMDADDLLLEDGDVKKRIMERSTLSVGMPAENNDAWNRAYRATSPDSKVIVQVSDDFEAPQGWDDMILERLDRAGGIDKPLVLGVGDPHFTPPYSGDGLLTIIIATRAYLEQVGGFLLYPEYISVFSDNDFTDKAALDGVLVNAYDIMFFHHWHGSDTDPLRDETHCRHMTTECNHMGSQVWGERTWAGFPDVTVHDGPVDWDYHLCPPLKGAPIEDIHDKIVDYRKARIKAISKGDNITNKPFALGDPRADWMAGRWKEARDGIEEIMGRVHLNYCSNRFLMHGAHFIWYKCTEILKDKPLVGVRDVHR